VVLAALALLVLSGVFSSMFTGRKALGPRRATWAALVVGVPIVALAATLPVVGRVIGRQRAKASPIS